MTCTSAAAYDKIWLVGNQQFLLINDISTPPEIWSLSHILSSWAVKIGCLLSIKCWLQNYSILLESSVLDPSAQYWTLLQGSTANHFGCRGTHELVGLLLSILLLAESECGHLCFYLCFFNFSVSKGLIFNLSMTWMSVSQCSTVIYLSCFTTPKQF